MCPPGSVPNFVSAFHCFWLTGTSSAAIEKLASELDEAIVAHQARRPPRIFISHRHKDQNVARKLIDLLKSGFRINRGDIRCTSVPGYKLAVGSQSADSLQADLIGAEIVMGLIGPDTARRRNACLQLIEDVGRVSSLKRKASSGRGRAEAVRRSAYRLARAAKG